MRDCTGKEGGEGEEVRTKGVFTHFYALAGHARETRDIFFYFLYSVVIISESVYQLKVSSPYASALALTLPSVLSFSFSFLFFPSCSSCLFRPWPCLRRSAAPLAPLSSPPAHLWTRTSRVTVCHPLTHQATTDALQNSTPSTPPPSAASTVFPPLLPPMPSCPDTPSHTLLLPGAIRSFVQVQAVSAQSSASQQAHIPPLCFEILLRTKAHLIGKVHSQFSSPFTPNRICPSFLRANLPLTLWTFFRVDLLHALAGSPSSLTEPPV